MFQGNQGTIMQEICPVDKKNNTLLPTQIPKGHEKYSEADKEKCPYFQIQQKVNSTSTEASESKCPYKGNEPTPEEIFDEMTMGGVATKPGEKKKKKKKPQGGCPFMPGENKKNPGLEPLQEAHNIRYISTLSYLLNFRGLFGPAAKEKRKDFDKYPIYLKHTIFHNEDENMKKVRELEISHRFFIYDKFRESGNKAFIKGKLSEAVQCYERAMSCFKWLEVIENEDDDEDDPYGMFGGLKKQLKQKMAEAEKNKENAKEEPQTDEMFQQKQGNSGDQVKQRTNINKKKGDHEIDIPLSKEEQQEDVEEEKKETEEDKKMVEQMKEEQKEFKKKFKSVLMTYSDDNVKLHDEKEVTDSNDKEMVNSLLLTIYLNLSVCYMKMNHFRLAQQAIDDAFAINDKSAICFFRRSQARAYNKDSTLDDLELAKKDLLMAFELKKVERIFQSEPGILKILNLSNAEEQFVLQGHYVEKRIKELTEFKAERLKSLFGRCKEIQIFEQEMIDKGKLPPEGYDEEYLVDIEEENTEYEVTCEIMARYYRIIEFYQEQKADGQVNTAKKELQYVKQILFEMDFYRDFDVTKCQGDSTVQEILKEIELDIDNIKLIKRFNRLKNAKIKELFENAKFNFDVFKYALDEYFKRKKEIQKQKEEEEEETKVVENTQGKTLFSRIFRTDFLIAATFILLIFVFLYFGQKGNNYLIKK